MFTATKVLSYIWAIAFVMFDIVMFFDLDYSKINGENILQYAFLIANVVVWTFYFIRNFCIEFSKETKE